MKAIFIARDRDQAPAESNSHKKPTLAIYTRYTEAEKPQSAR